MSQVQEIWKREIRKEEWPDLWSDEDEDEDEDENDNIIYLAVQHGMNLADKHAVYSEIDCRFKNIIRYAKPYELLQSEPFLPLAFNPVDNSTSTFQKMIIDGKFKTSCVNRKITLPPLTFTIQPADFDIDTFRILMGVWKITTKHNKFTNCEQILNMTDWYQRLFHTNEFVTLPFLLKGIYKIIEENNDIPSNVDVGIVSCNDQLAYKAKLGTRLRDENHASYADAVVLGPLIPEQSLFLNNFYTKYQFALSILTVPPNIDIIDRVSTWSPLANTTSVGCGINILALYGLIDENVGRARVCVLPTKGQSIFSIYTEFSKILTIPTKFIVIRFDVDNAVKVLHAIIPGLLNNTATIIKMYKDKMHGEKNSHVGHTISIFKLNDKYYIVDPQQRINYEIKELTKVFNFYNTNFVDIVFTARESIDTASGLRPVFTADAMIASIATYNGQIIVCDPQIDFGGKTMRKKTTRIKRRRIKRRKTRRTRRTKKTRRTRRTKRRSKTRINKTMVFSRHI